MIVFSTTSKSRSVRVKVAYSYEHEISHSYSTSPAIRSTCGNDAPTGTVFRPLSLAVGAVIPEAESEAMTFGISPRSRAGTRTTRSTSNESVVGGIRAVNPANQEGWGREAKSNSQPGSSEETAY